MLILVLFQVSSRFSPKSGTTAAPSRYEKPWNSSVVSHGVRTSLSAGSSCGRYASLCEFACVVAHWILPTALKTGNEP